MAVDRRAANLKVLKEAEEKQNLSKEAIWRIQRQAAETEQIGTATLEELRKQGQQMDEIGNEIDKVSSQLDRSQQLQNRFDLWAGNWLGGKKRAAMKEAQAEIAQRQAEENQQVKEVFEHETYVSLSRTWKGVGLYFCNNPTQAAPDVFDPAEQEAQGAESNWVIDYSLTGIDAEGWTYAYDFDSLNKKGVGESSAKWNTYVRRRKWRYHEKRGGGNAALQEVKDRNTARISHQRTNPNQGEKIGYVPRAQIQQMKASGLTSAGMMRGHSAGGSDELDEDSAAGLANLKRADQEIDDGIDKISNTLDNLAGIASGMRSEITSQTAKIERVSVDSLYAICYAMLCSLICI